MILMTHPKHGFHHAYSPVDVQEHLDNGWVAVAKEPEEIKKPQISTAELKRRYQVMFHKKPHWNLNRHNLQKALDRGV